LTALFTPHLKESSLFHADESTAEKAAAEADGVLASQGNDLAVSFMVCLNDSSYRRSRNVRFGSEADFAALHHVVRFVPEVDVLI
jgi:hypothetical protein